MIFVTLGSQKFQFNRLLMKLDELIEAGIIQDEIFAQIGVSDYIPKHYAHEAFMDREQFTKMMDQCDIVITHGGTGVIINAVKRGKKVIATPRLAQFGEHVDDHQLQLLHQFDDLGIIYACYNLEQLEEAYISIQDMTFRPYISNTRVIIESIDSYLCDLK